MGSIESERKASQRAMCALASIFILAVATVEVAFANPDHHEHHGHNHVAPHLGAEEDYVSPDNSYLQDNYHPQYTTVYESLEYGTAETYGADHGATVYGQMDKLKSIFDVSPKVKVKLLSILIVLVLLVGVVALEVVLDFYMNIKFMNRARELQQGFGRANNDVSLNVDPETVMSIVSAVGNLYETWG